MNTAEQVATTEELVEHIHTSKAEQSDETRDRNQLTTELHHVHLPKLTDEGVIEYDPRSQQLRYHGEKRLEEWLERIEREERQS